MKSLVISVLLGLIISGGLYFIASPYLTWRQTKSTGGTEKATVKTKDGVTPYKEYLEKQKSAGKKIGLSLVIPSYNEQERLPIMLNDALTHLNAKGYTYEIIVVDDASKDKTTEVALKYSEFQGKPVDLKVINYPVNKGKGGAVRLGMLLAQGDHILMVDADGATKFSDIDTLFKRLKDSPKKNVGIVAGSRNLKSDEVTKCVNGACFKGNCVNGNCLDDYRVDEKCVSENKISHGCTGDVCSDGTCFDGQCLATKCVSKAVIERGPIRRFLMGVSNFIVNNICGIDLKDTQCGFKLFTHEAAKKIFTPLHLERWAFDVEAFIIAKELSYDALEVPVTWKEIDGSNLNVVTASITMARDYLMVKLLYVSGLWTTKDSVL